MRLCYDFIKTLILVYSHGKTELSEVNLYNIILDYLIYHEFI